MKQSRLPAVSGSPPLTEPISVRLLQVLGHGRAAQAELVEATMPDGQRQWCVEKVFAAGWLTRTIYRLSFQAPFAYQSNRDAILACLYRRRVAAAVLEASDTSVRIARPLYVRYDRQRAAWILAAEWIRGRGIRPAPANPNRLRRRLGRRAEQRPAVAARPNAEVNELVETMHELESLFSQCGLTGSGWQVAPRAMVSTANLLRQPAHYTIIDLESGIPAVLVPKYLLSGARRAQLPPFDDLDPDQLLAWLDDNERRLQLRIGIAQTRAVRADVEKLIEHSERWKDSELALLRRPWRLLRRDGMRAYQRECIRRWQQEGTVDADSAESLHHRPWKGRMIWWAGLLPGRLGRVASRCLGNTRFRERVIRVLSCHRSRAEEFHTLIRDREKTWIEEERLRPETVLSPIGFAWHQMLSVVTPRPLHRFLCDRNRRRDWLRQGLQLLFSPQYQAQFGYRRIESAIESWHRAERISDLEAEQLRQQLSGKEVRTYVRGFGAHLALKVLTPIAVPAKYGGLAAFLASGNLWFLLPMLLMPAARTLITLASWWSSRVENVPHGEALLAGLLPVVGSAAFPLQLFAARSELSTFLIRDAASKLGRRIPIYGGPNSRTEIALIRGTDILVETLHVFSQLSPSRQPCEQAVPESGDRRSPVIPISRGMTRWSNAIGSWRNAVHRLDLEVSDYEPAKKTAGRQQAA
jgi:hypothetical protein